MPGRKPSAKTLYKRSRDDWRKLKRVSYRRRTAPRRALPYALPNTYVCKLRYVSEFALDAETGGTAVTKVFRASDLYDPDYTGAGHQPAGFDQLMTFYNHFVVLGSMLKMVFAPTTSASATPCYYGVTLSDGGNYIGSLQGIEKIYEQERTSRPQQGGTLQPLAFDMRRPAIRKYSLKKFFKTKDIGDDQYEGSDSASPTENAFFECWACSVSNNEPASANFLVVIEYIAKFTGPKNLAQS